MAEITQPQPPFRTSYLFDSLFHKTVENNILPIDTEGKITTINRPFTNGFGYTLEDLRGKGIIQKTNREKQNEKNTSHLNNLNENILAAIDALVIVMDGELNIIKQNHAFGFLFIQPWSKSKLSNFEDLIKPHDPHKVLIDLIKNTATNKIP